MTRDVPPKGLVFPKCPECGAQLERVIGNEQLCSYPPYYFFGCDACDFQGYVILEFEKIDGKAEEVKSFLFGSAVVCTNPQWIANMKVKDDS